MIIFLKKFFKLLALPLTPSLFFSSIVYYSEKQMHKDSIQTLLTSGDEPHFMPIFIAFFIVFLLLSIRAMGLYWNRKQWW